MCVWPVASGAGPGRHFSGHIIVKPKAVTGPIYTHLMHELDLHGHTVDEALRAFVDFYNRHVRSGSRESMRVIHGYGSSGEGGKIQRKLRLFIEGAAHNLAWKPGEDVEGNPGVTIVYPRRLLPEPRNQLTAEILAFCSIPRTESKIAGQFRKHDAREIKQAVRALVRSGRMRVVVKGNRETYVSTPGSDLS